MRHPNLKLNFAYALFAFALVLMPSPAHGANLVKQCVGLWEVVARRPWREVRIDDARAIKWVAAHPPEFRDAAEFVMNTLRSQTISQAEFLTHLDSAVKKFEAAHPSEALVLIDVKESKYKSVDWVTGAVLSRNPELKTRSRIARAHKPVQLEDRPVKVIFEDANITGFAMRSRLSVLKHFSNEDKFTVVFAMSNPQAEKIIRETCPKCEIISGDRQVLSLNDRLLEIPEPRRSDLLVQLRKMYLPAELDSPLVITAHRLSDSLPKFIRKGEVFNLNSPTHRRIPFVVTPPPPYRLVPKPKK